MCYSEIKKKKFVNWPASTKLHLYNIYLHIYLNLNYALHINDNQATSVIINRQSIPFKFLR